MGRQGLPSGCSCPHLGCKAPCIVVAPFPGASGKPSDVGPGGNRTGLLQPRPRRAGAAWPPAQVSVSSCRGHGAARGASWSPAAGLRRTCFRGGEDTGPGRPDNTTNTSRPAGVAAHEAPRSQPRRPASARLFCTRRRPPSPADVPYSGRRRPGAQSSPGALGDATPAIGRKQPRLMPSFSRVPEGDSRSPSLPGALGLSARGHQDTEPHRSRSASAHQSRCYSYWSHNWNGVCVPFARGRGITPGTCSLVSETSSCDRVSHVSVPHACPPSPTPTAHVNRTTHPPPSLR